MGRPLSYDLRKVFIKLIKKGAQRGKLAGVVA